CPRFLRSAAADPTRSQARHRARELRRVSRDVKPLVRLTFGPPHCPWFNPREPPSPAFPANRRISHRLPMPTESPRQPIPPATFAVLPAYLEARAAFTDDDFETVEAAFLFKRLSSGDFLQRAGDVTRHAAFVAAGCLRNYVIDDKGKEHIVQ